MAPSAGTVAARGIQCVPVSPSCRPLPRAGAAPLAGAEGRSRLTDAGRSRPGTVTRGPGRSFPRMSRPRGRDTPRLMKTCNLKSQAGIESRLSTARRHTARPAPGSVTAASAGRAGLRPLIRAAAAMELPIGGRPAAACPLAGPAVTLSTPGRSKRRGAGGWLDLPSGRTLPTEPTPLAV